LYAIFPRGPGPGEGRAEKSAVPFLRLSTVSTRNPSQDKLIGNGDPPKPCYCMQYYIYYEAPISTELDEYWIILRLPESYFGLSKSKLFSFNIYFIIKFKTVLVLFYVEK